MDGGAWLTKPEIIFSISFGLLSLLISVSASVYPAAFRRVFGLPSKSLKRTMLATFEDDLRQIELLNENSFELILWTLWNVLTAIRLIFWVWIASICINVTYLLVTGKLLWTSFFGGFGSSAFGILIGRFQRMYHTIHYLYRYKRSVAMLKKNISSLKQELGLEAVEEKQ